MDRITAEQEASAGMGERLRNGNQGGMAPRAGSPGAFAFASPFGPRIMLAPEGGDGGGAPPAVVAGAEPPAGGDEPPVTPPEAAARPEFIPEDWWDSDKGFKSDDFNALVARDAERAAQLAQVPEAADKYEAKLPHDFKLPDGFELPEGESLIDADDPRISAARDFALANQFSQSQFETMIAMGVNLDLAEQGQLKDAVGKQLEALGAKGQERVAAVRAWVGAKLPGAQAEALAAMMYTKTQIEAFEGLMRLNRGAVPGGPGAGRDTVKPEMSDEEYYSMSPAERINYARQNSKK